MEASGFWSRSRKRFLHSTRPEGPIRPRNGLEGAEPFGLFRLDAPVVTEENGEPLHTDTALRTDSHGQCDADIIAVHGLGGTVYKTWTHENGKMWLRDFAPAEFRGARIYSFGYDSGFAFSKGTSTLRDSARSLLEAIKLERTTPTLSARPLIFVCHSMGGIVAKLAINIAHNEPHHYPGTGKALTGILFLGTPHQGSPHARYASILAQTANIFVIGSQMSRFTGPVRTDLLRSLRRHEPELLGIAEDFRAHTADIKIMSFVEGKEMLGLNTRIVDDYSAFVGAYTERKIPMPGYDHRGICRHESSTTPGLKLLIGAIRECLLPSDPKFASNTSGQISDLAPYIQIPFQSDRWFVGQENIIEQLRSIFNDDLGSHQVALYGLSGIGKSQVALEFARELREGMTKTSIFWVFAGTKERFEQDYIGIARGLEIPGYNDPEVDVLALVKNSLQKPKFGKWVMIIDNADDLSLFYGTAKSDHYESTSNVRYPDGLFNYIPNSPTGSVLYTTRNKVDALQLTGEGNIIQVKEMNVEDLKSILRHKLGNEAGDEHEWTELIHSLERLPLALVQAASYIRQNSWSVSKYLNYFRGRDEDLAMQFLLHDFQDKSRDESVANAVFKTWLITAQLLETHYPQAANMLWKMVFYNWENIPRCLLLDDQAENPEHGISDERQDNLDDSTEVIKTAGPVDNERAKDAGGLSEYCLDKAAGVLNAYSFITIVSDGEEEGYTLHRLVQIFTRYWLKKHKKISDHWEAKALASLCREFPKSKYEDWPKSAQLLPHVQGFVDSQHAAKSSTRAYGGLLTNVSTYMRLKGQYSLAERYINVAMHTLRTSFGDDDPATIEASSRLALIYRDARRFDDAENLLRVAMYKSAELMGRLHPKTFETMMNLGSVLRHQKKYDEATTLARDCVDGLAKLDHPETDLVLDSKMSLATTLGTSGQREEALEIQRAVAQVLSETHDEKYPRLLDLQHDLAVTLNMVGEFDEARTLSQKVLDLNSTVYGPEHPRTANIEFNLAIILQKQGYYAQAEKHFRKILDYREQNKVGDYIDTVQCLRCLSSCLENQHCYSDALSYLDRALKEAMAKPAQPGDRVGIMQDLERLFDLQSGENDVNYTNSRAPLSTLIYAEGAAYAAGATYAASASCIAM